MNKAARARFAKETINEVIPHILRTNERAKRGIESSELVSYSQDAVSKKSRPISTTTELSEELACEPLEAPEPKVPKTRVIQSDTYNAALLFLNASKTHGRTAVLNMASALHPGGGVLRGSLAQEESLCLRSTLLPSLQDSFYRIPNTAAIYTPDVLVFRSSDNADLPKASWHFVDVISCAAIKHPDLVRDEKRGMVYEREQDQEMMVMKVRLILQVARQKKITHLVLGAFGCGAYGNPPAEVANIFRRVLLGDRKREGVEWIEEVAFAIFDDGENLRVFRDIFRDVNV